MSSLVRISGRVSYVRGLLSEFASLPLMHPQFQTQQMVLTCVLCPVPHKLLSAEERTHDGPILAEIWSDSVCRLALKDWYLPLLPNHSFLIELNMLSYLN